MDLAKLGFEEAAKTAEGQHEGNADNTDDHVAIRLDLGQAAQLGAQLDSSAPAIDAYREHLDPALDTGASRLAEHLMVPDSAALLAKTLADLEQQRSDALAPLRLAREAMEDPLARQITEALEHSRNHRAFDEVDALDEIRTFSPPDIPRNPIYDTNKLLAEQGRRIEQQEAHAATVRSAVVQLATQVEDAIVNSKRDAFWSKVIAVVATIVALASLGLSAFSELRQPPSTPTTQPEHLSSIAETLGAPPDSPDLFGGTDQTIEPPPQPVRDAQGAPIDSSMAAPTPQE